MNLAIMPEDMATKMCRGDVISALSVAIGDGYISGLLQMFPFLTRLDSYFYNEVLL